MKKLATILTIVLFFAAVALSFFAGDHMRDKAYKEEQAERFDKYISISIDTLEKKGLSVDGV